MPAAVILPFIAVETGIAAAIGATVVEAVGIGAVSSAVATAVGTGVVSGAITAAQGGSAGDVLQSAVLGGAGAYIGGQIGEQLFGGASSAAAEAAANATSDPIAAMNGIRGWTISDIPYLESIGASPAIIQAAQANNAAIQAGQQPAKPPTQEQIDMANKTNNPTYALDVAQGNVQADLTKLYEIGADGDLIKLAASNNSALGVAPGGYDANILKFVDLPESTQQYLLKNGFAPNTNDFIQQFAPDGSLLKDVYVMRGNEMLTNAQYDMATGKYYNLYGEEIAAPWFPETGAQVVDAEGSVIMNDNIFKGIDTSTDVTLGATEPAPYKVTVTGAAGTAEAPQYAVPQNMTPGSELATQQQIDAGLANWNPNANAWEVAPAPAPTYEIPSNIQESVFDPTGISAGSYAGAGSTAGAVAPTVVETPTSLPSLPSAPVETGSVVNEPYMTAPSVPTAPVDTVAQPTYQIPSNVQESVFDPTMTSGGSYSGASGGVPAPVVDAAPAIPGTNNPLGNADIPLSTAAGNFLSTPVGLGTALGLGALATGVLTPEAESRGGRGWSALPPLTWGKTQSLVNPGLNPGWLVGAQPYYATTAPNQPQFYWGKQPYVANMEQLSQPRAAIPAAPAVPFGAAPSYQPLNIPQFVQQYVTPQATQALAGQTTPLIPVAPQRG